MYIYLGIYTKIGMICNGARRNHLPIRVDLRLLLTFTSYRNVTQLF